MGKLNDLAERPSTLLSLRAPAEKPEQPAEILCMWASTHGDPTLHMASKDKR